MLINSSLSFEGTLHLIDSELIAKHINNKSRLEPNTQSIFIQRRRVSECDPICCFVVELDCEITGPHYLSVVFYLDCLLELVDCHVYHPVEYDIGMQLIIPGEWRDSISQRR